MATSLDVFAQRTEGVHYFQSKGVAIKVALLLVKRPNGRFRKSLERWSIPSSSVFRKRRPTKKKKKMWNGNDEPPKKEKEKKTRKKMIFLNNDGRSVHGVTWINRQGQKPDRSHYFTAGNPGPDTPRTMAMAGLHVFTDARISQYPDTGSFFFPFFSLTR